MGAARILALALASTEPELIDLAERFHRASGWSESADAIDFWLERHPDNFTSVQHFRYDVARDVLEFKREDIIELHVSAPSHCQKDIDRYFDNGYDDFDGCTDEAAVEERAWLLGRQFGCVVAESFSVGNEFELGMSEAILDRIEAIKREIVEIYPQLFVERSLEWVRALRK